LENLGKSENRVRKKSKIHYDPLSYPHLFPMEVCPIHNKYPYSLPIKCWVFYQFSTNKPSIFHLEIPGAPTSISKSSDSMRLCKCPAAYTSRRTGAFCGYTVGPPVKRGNGKYPMNIHTWRFNGKSATLYMDDF
jgi:hypothetical protein